MVVFLSFSHKLGLFVATTRIELSLHLIDLQSELVDFVPEVFQIKGVFLLLVDELFLLLLQRFIGLVALPPPVFQQLSFPLLLPAFIVDEFIYVFGADLSLEDS